ncbi:hypothetical protein AMECASPLE_013467 [Ameca splendens]|uniref:Uncharacterized protein n=1 Tax=Ameca splendens TaxID=208324 RepID=A0ABV1AAV2_9TELE
MFILDHCPVGTLNCVPISTVRVTSPPAHRRRRRRRWRRNQRADTCGAARDSEPETVSCAAKLYYVLNAVQESGRITRVGVRGVDACGSGHNKTSALRVLRLVGARERNCLQVKSGVSTPHFSQGQAEGQ